MTYGSISVLMPLFNAAATAAFALESVVRQRRRPDQVILVDDGSSDATPQIVEAFARNNPSLRVSLVRHKENLGLTAALISGMAYVDSDWVARLDADDCWLDSHLECFDRTRVDPGLNGLVLYCARARIVRSGATLGYSTGPCRDLELRARLLWDNPVVHSGVVFCTRSYYLAGGYRHGVRWEDFDLWVRLLRIGSGRILNNVTVEYAASGSGISSINYSIALSARSDIQETAARQLWPWLGVFGRLPALLTRRRAQFAARRMSK